MQITDLYENFRVFPVEFKAEEKRFDYASATSIHSVVTDWAYGTPLKRSCVDISGGDPLTGKIGLDDLRGRFYLKITACMPNWTKLVNSLRVLVNGIVVYDEREAFFEQVNLGWPSLYIKADGAPFKRGTNEITLSTDNASGGGLYISEVSLVVYPEISDREQISSLRYAKKGGIFGVAVKDERGLCKGVGELVGCSLLKQSRYKDLCVFSFLAEQAGQAQGAALFGDGKTKLSLPVIVENDDEFLLGADSDDHRHDNSDEASFIPERLIFSGMGNFLQFRPQIGRNYYKLAGEDFYRKIISLAGDFGMKYGLADSNGVMKFLPDVSPKDFYGYHIHEPYLFFNPALLENPYEKDWFLCDPESVNALTCFGEGKALYESVLKRSKAKFSCGKGLTSFGSPSLLCVYEGDAGVDRLTIEPVSNVNLLAGAVRATSVGLWGAHIPTDWYFGVPVDRVKSNKFRLAMQYLYLSGASYIYAENALFKTNAFERCDAESEFCALNRKYLRDFYDYTLTHPRKGRLKTSKAVVYGRHEFFMWKTNDRIAELKEEDWDSKVWGKWDNSYHTEWNAVEEWLPASEKQNLFESPLNKKLFSGTPFGNVDIVSAEKDFSQYSQLVFLGWNTMNDELLSRLENYVFDGGTLVLSYAHFNCSDANYLEPKFPESDRLKDFIGLEITGEDAARRVRFGDESFMTSDLKIVAGKTLTATPIALNEKGRGVVYENSYGKGKVYFLALKEHITNEKDLPVYKKAMRVAAERGDEFCDNDSVSFTVRETRDEYILSVLNMNCIDGADEQFKINYKGRSVVGNVKVGEILRYELKK